MSERARCADCRNDAYGVVMLGCARMHTRNVASCNSHYALLMARVGSSTSPCPRCGLPERVLKDEALDE